MTYMLYLLLRNGSEPEHVYTLVSDELKLDRLMAEIYIIADFEPYDDYLEAYNEADAHGADLDFELTKQRYIRLMHRWPPVPLVQSELQMQEKVKRPELPVEVWNPNPVDKERAWTAVMDMCRGTN